MHCRESIQTRVTQSKGWMCHYTSYTLHLNANESQPEFKNRNETVKESALGFLSVTNIQGWPDKRSEWLTYLHAYWNNRDELSITV